MNALAKIKTIYFLHSELKTNNLLIRIGRRRRQTQKAVSVRLTTLTISFIVATPVLLMSRVNSSSAEESISSEVSNKSTGERTSDSQEVIVDGNAVGSISLPSRNIHSKGIQAHSCGRKDFPFIRFHCVMENI